MQFNTMYKKQIRTLMYIMLAFVSVVFADVFLFSEKTYDFWWNDYISESSQTERIDVETLRQRHAQYMEEGINQSEVFVSLNKKPSSERLKSVPPKPNRDTNSSDTDIASADFFLPNTTEGAQEESITIASIQPASEMKDIKPVKAELNDLEAAFSNMIANIEPAIGATPETHNIVKSQTQKEVQQKKYSYTSPNGKGQIAVIIDDMGLSLRSRQVEVLPGPLTLSYLPYAENLKKGTHRALQNGHELMVHMPMEPMNSTLDGGPRVLRVTQSDSELIETLEWGLSQFDGYVGINNHMGSRVTSDKKSMDIVMSHLKKSGLFFIDSRTISSSVAAQSARDIGLPYAERDIFLDHKITADFIEGALQKLEKTAKRKGYAIAIGHPHKETIAALKKWIPTLKDKGLTLVPASALIKHPVSVENVARAQ